MQDQQHPLRAVNRPPLTARRPGRPRKNHNRNPLGRYPFIVLTQRFLRETEAYYADTTHRRMRYDLLYMARVFGQLKQAGLVDTTNPRKFTSREIGAYFAWLNGRDGLREAPMGLTGQHNSLKLLNTFLRHQGNFVIDQMMREKVIRIPARKRGPLASPAEAEVRAIIDKLQAVAANGCGELAVFGMTLLCAYGGLRFKEAHLATIGDLDLTGFRVLVKHPKGEASYASPRLATIVPPGRAALKAFVELRASAFTRAGAVDGPDAPLVPYFGRDGPSHWRENVLRMEKCRLAADHGISFEFRALRRSFGQNSLDRGAGIESVSVALGHSTTRTTETYYARRKADQAFRELEGVWSS